MLGERGCPQILSQVKEEEEKEEEEEEDDDEEHCDINIICNNVQGES
jgi:hypothetical protein